MLSTHVGIVSIAKITNSTSASKTFFLYRELPRLAHGVGGQIATLNVHVRKARKPSGFKKGFREKR